MGLDSRILSVCKQKPAPISSDSLKCQLFNGADDQGQFSGLIAAGRTTPLSNYEPNTILSIINPTDTPFQETRVNYTTIGRTLFIPFSYVVGISAEPSTFVNGRNVDLSNIVSGGVNFPF